MSGFVPQTDIQSWIDQIESLRPPTNRSATDVTSPFSLLAMVRESDDQATAHLSGKLLEALVPLVAESSLLTSDVWLAQILKAVQSYRSVKYGWDGERGAPPDQIALDAAEMLAVHLSTLPESRRPQFSLGTDGVPAFARHLQDFYLHLMVEPAQEPNCVASLTWYALIDGQKKFAADVPFDGKKLPRELKALAHV